MESEALQTEIPAAAPAASRTGPLRTFGLAWLLAFTGAVTPGPMLALVVGQVLAQGFAAVLFILLGHALLEAVFIAGFALGLMRFLNRRRTRGALSLIGGLALAAMGLDIILHAGDMTLAGGAGQALAWPMLVLAGVGVSLSNPYFTGWWATVGAGQVAAFRLRGLSGYASFWLGHEMGDIVWYVFVAAVLALGRSALNDRVYQGLLLACGIVICLLSLIFLGLGLRCFISRGNPTPENTPAPS